MTAEYEKFQNWANQGARLYQMMKEAINDATLKVVSEDLAITRSLEVPKRASEFPKSAAMLKALTEAAMEWAEELFDKAPASFVVIARGALYTMRKASPGMFAELHRVIREVEHVSSRRDVSGSDGEPDSDRRENTGG